MAEKQHYVPALGFGFLTPLYDPLVALTTRERTFKRLLVEQSGVRAGERVLDLACGTGTLAVRLKLAVPGALVCGVDGDRQVLARARRKAARAGVDIRFDRGLSHALPYAERSFARVLSSLFFHHLLPADKRAALREVYRVLAPGGELHVADWGKAGNRALRGAFYVVQLLDGFENTRDNVEGRLPQLIAEAGFAQVALRRELATMLGTIALYSAVKRGEGA